MNTDPLVAEILIVVWFSTVGACTVSLAGPTPALRWQATLLAPLVGMIASGVIGSVVAALELARLPWFVALGGTALCVASVAVAWRRGAVASLAVSTAVAGGLAVVAVCVLFVSIRPVLTFDSYRFVVLGRAARSGRLANDSASAADFPFLITHVQALARGLRAEYSVYAANVAACLGLAGALGVAAATVPASQRRQVQAFGGFALVVVVLSSYVMRVQLAYLNSHLVAAASFASIVALVAWCAKHGAATPELQLIGVLLAGYAIVRVEGLLVVTILVVVLVSAVPLTKSDALQVGLLGVALPGFWYTVLAVAGARGDILNPLALAVLLVAPWAALALGRVSPTNPARHLVTPRAMILVMMLAILGQSLVRRPEALESLSTMVTNALVQGGWGPVWWLVLAVPAALSFRRGLPADRTGARSMPAADRRPQQLWFGAIGAYTAMVALLGAVRSLPYREGWGDSGNRMLVHVVPAIVIAFAVAAAALRDTDTHGGGDPDQYGSDVEADVVVV